MRNLRSKRTLAAAAALAVVGGSWVAIAAAAGGSAPSPQSFFNDVAKHLGISPEKLHDATKAAALDQVDAALKAGTITKAQADQLKAEINSGRFPPFLAPFLGAGHMPGHRLLAPLPPRGFGFGLFGVFPGAYASHSHLSAVADYLGLTVAQLRQQLSSGKSLSDIAKAQGKSVDGLEQAIIDNAKKRLDQAVAKGTLTQAQADQILSELKEHVSEIVSGRFGLRPHLMHWRMEHHFFGMLPGGPRWHDRDRFSGVPPRGPAYWGPGA
jgi:hypothetical protein